MRSISNSETSFAKRKRTLKSGCGNEGINCLRNMFAHLDLYRGWSCKEDSIVSGEPALPYVLVSSPTAPFVRSASPHGFLCPQTRVIPRQTACKDVCRNSSTYGSSRFSRIIIIHRFKNIISGKSIKIQLRCIVRKWYKILTFWKQCAKITVTFFHCYVTVNISCDIRVYLIE